MGKDRHREVYALAIALLGHLLFLTLSPKQKKEPPPPPPAETASDTTFDIETTPAPAALPSPANTANETNQAAPPIAQESPPAAARANANPSGNAAAPESASQGESGSEDESDSEPSPNAAALPSGPSAQGGDEFGGPPSSGPNLGIPGLPGVGAGPIWAIPGVISAPSGGRPAPTTIEAARPVDADVASKVLSGTLHTKDKSTGIQVPAAGVVAQSVASAVRGSAVMDSRATFEVKLNGEGQVEGVRLVSSTDGNAQHWTGVVEAVRASLGGKALQMGPDKQGVTVVVKVESKVQYPAGTKEKVDVQPVCANEVIEQIADMAQEAMKPGGSVRGIRDDQGQFIPYSELDEERRRLFCIPIGVRAKGDLSNLGAKMTNVVSTSFEIKRAGEKPLPAGAPLPIDRRAPWLPASENLEKPPPRPKKKKKKKKP